MKYINVGYTENESVNYRNDFKAIKIGNDRVLLCDELQVELKELSNSEKLSGCIRIFNEQCFNNS